MSLFYFSILRIKCAAKVQHFFHICKNKMRTTLFFLPIWQFFARALVYIKTFL